ncbi:MAG: 2-hydroxyacyl-CoA dehydratase subunit D [Candidatus Helarchaeota archaeon]
MMEDIPESELKRGGELWRRFTGFWKMGKELADSMSDEDRNKQGMMGNNAFLDVMLEYSYNYYKAKREGKPVVMYNFCVPPELFYAIDIYPLCQEAGSVAIAVAASNLEYIDAAEERGIAREQCNAQKTWMGAAMINEAPESDLIIYASQPCDSTNIQYQVIQDIYNSPTYTLDVPYWSYEEKSPYYDPMVIPYFAQQIKSMVGWLEKKTGHKMEFEKLKNAVDLSNKARELILESTELMKAVPAPMPSLTAFTNYMVLLTSAGTPSPLPYCEWTLNTAKERVKHKQGAINLRGKGRKEEKIRVLWVYIPLFFDPFIFDWMERKYGAVIVMDMLGLQMARPVDTSSEQKIYEDLGKVTLEMPMARQSRGPMEFYLDDILMLIKEFKADCCIWGGHVGCKHSWAVAQLMMEEVKKATDIPFLTFEVDTMDGRVVDSKTIKNRLKVFFESMK